MMLEKMHSWKIRKWLLFTSLPQDTHLKHSSESHFLVTDPFIRAAALTTYRHTSNAPLKHSEHKLLGLQKPKCIVLCAAHAVTTGDSKGKATAF